MIFSKIPVIGIFISFLILYSIFIIAKSFRNSIFFNKPDRVDVIYYGPKTALLSFGLEDNVNYIAFFGNDTKITVPGGYGRYNVGSLGRLSDLEKKPVIIKKAFSDATSNYIDFYLLPKKSTIFFGDKNKEDEFFVPKLNIVDVFLNYRFLSDAGFLDRLFLFLQMQNARKADFLEINTNVYEEGSDKFFSEEDFARAYKGYFYQKTLRNEEKNIQILYRNYKTAQSISRIIEGEGIQVADLNITDINLKGCLLKTGEEKISRTSLYLVNRFGCTLKKSPTGGYDIIMILGADVENDWEG